MVVWECELVNHTVETIQRVAVWLRHETAAANQFRYDELVVDRRELLSVAEKKVRYRIASYDEKPDLSDSGAHEVQQPCKPSQFAVVDLFSGAGGMSYGFHMHPAFRIVGAADAELGKPSTGRGKLQCNSTYVQNIGVSPARLDLSAVPPGQLRSALALPEEQRTPVLDLPPMHGVQPGEP